MQYQPRQVDTLQSHYILTLIWTIENLAGSQEAGCYILSFKFGDESKREMSHPVSSCCVSQETFDCKWVKM